MCGISVDQGNEVRRYTDDKFWNGERESGYSPSHSLPFLRLIGSRVWVRVRVCKSSSAVRSVLRAIKEGLVSQRGAGST